MLLQPFDDPPPYVAAPSTSVAPSTRADVPPGGQPARETTPPAVVALPAPVPLQWSVRLSGGLGLSDKDISLRGSLEGEVWTADWLAFGGRIVAGGDGEFLFGTTRRNLYFAEPVVLLGLDLLGGLRMVASAGLGVAYREEVTLPGWFSTTPTTSTSQMDFTASVSAGVISYGRTHFAYSVLVRVETAGVTTWAATLNLGLGVAY